METLFTGIDISKQDFHCMTAFNREDIFDRKKVKKFSNNKEGIKAFISYIKKEAKKKQIHVVMESTGVYGNLLAYHLKAKGIKLSIVNPKRIYSFIDTKKQLTKTDKLDAISICEFAILFNPEEAKLPNKDIKILRDLTREKESNTKMLTVLRNKLEAKNHDKITSSICIKHLKAKIKFIEQQMKELDEEISKIINNDEELKEDNELIVSIPGIKKTAEIILSELKTQIRSGISLRKLVAYCGLCPYIKQSGTSLNSKGHISNQSNKKIGKALYFPTLSAIRYNPVIREKYQSLLSRGKLKKVAIVACMRKMLCIIYGVLKNRKPFNPEINKNVA